jgi:hypothetical protein
MRKGNGREVFGGLAAKGIQPVSRQTGVRGVSVGSTQSFKSPPYSQLEV